MAFEDLSIIIEGAIAKLGMDPAEARNPEQQGQWNIAKNENTQIMIDLWEENEHWFFQVLSPICPLADDDNSAFLKFLLEENHGICEAAFTILDNNVFLKYTTEAADLDEERAYKSIVRIAYYNEVFQEKLN
jgi:hypothetical protein